MPLTDAFLNTCRRKVEALAELTAFNSASALADDTRAERSAQWGRLYVATDSNGTTVAYRFSKAIRDTINAEADKHGAAGSGVVSTSERESAYGTLHGEYVLTLDRPLSATDELSALTTAINEDYLA